MKYTFDNLFDKTVHELQTIKKEQQDKLFRAKKHKISIITNIISLQNLVDVERGLAVSGYPKCFGQWTGSLECSGCSGTMDCYPATKI